MKTTAILGLLMLSLCALSTGYAHDKECKLPPGQGGDKGRPVKPEKVAILHCGCSESGDMMQYVEIMVSSKSRGHRKHVAGSIDSCSDGTENFNDFVRNGSDCQLSGNPMEDMEFCGDDKMALRECGSAVID